MDQLSLPHRLNRLWNKFRLLGFKQAFRSITAPFRPQTKIRIPLAGADRNLILASSVEAIRDFARSRKKGRLDKSEAGKDISHHFPLEFVDSKGTRMRYAFFPALAESKGLAVIFHGYLGFDIYQVRYGWKHFDLLLPLDNFGWKNLGSWFWGQSGNNFVDLAVNELVQNLRAEHNMPRWYCVGASMGGFAALYHGIKYQADGIYVMTPIIDVKSKIRDYRTRKIETSYTALAAVEDADLQHVPDIYIEAARAETLPPLFLIQNQYDRSNLFGDYTLPLLQTYNEKKAWLGLRVQPSIGHQGHDGSYDEAQYFFSLIAEKAPPRRVDFYAEDEGHSPS